MAHFNACKYYKKPYHYRSQGQTRFVKEKAFHNKRSIATVKRDDRRLRDERFITKQFRKGNSNGNGCRWQSSITHVTWSGIKHLVSRHLVARSAFKLWKEVCGLIQEKGRHELRDGPERKSPFFGIPARADGWPYRAAPSPKDA